nr:MAG TPA: hypothetical protein [Caudoviricetes sp.]
MLVNEKSDFYLLRYRKLYPLVLFRYKLPTFVAKFRRNPTKSFYLQSDFSFTKK